MVLSLCRDTVCVFYRKENACDGENEPNLRKKEWKKEWKKECLVLYLGYSLVEEVLPLCRDAVGVFYSPKERKKERKKILWRRKQTEFKKERKVEKKGQKKVRTVKEDDKKSLKDWVAE